MKLIQIQTGQAVRFIALAGLQGSLYGPALARGLEERYGFLQGPRSLDEWDLSKGISFYHGLFDKIVIEKFSIFSEGLVCETKVNSAIADRFLDDVLAWAREAGGFALPAGPSPRAYVSKINIQMDVALDRAIKGFSEFGRAIAEGISSYGRLQPPEYGVATLTFHVDGGTNTIGAPPPFSFERTINQPWSANHYYSSAPLATDDHIKVLEALERALTTS